MKRNKIIVLNILAGIVYLIMCSYGNGPATHGYDCTGAETGLQNPNGCTNCHGSVATAGTQIVLELDSAGISTTHYYPGMTYTIKLTATNNTGFSLPEFGFQMACIKGANAVVTPINAGSWVAPFPAGTHNKLPSAGNYVANIVEQMSTLPASTGNGAQGTTYSKSFSWKAPNAGTGTVSFWSVVNLVNGNGNNDSGDKWNTKQLVVAEWPISTDVSNIQTEMDFSAYPNPVHEYFNLQLKHAQSGAYTFMVYDLNGKLIANQNIEVGTENYTYGVNTAEWPQGYYKLVLKRNEFMKVLSFVKF